MHPSALLTALTIGIYSLSLVQGSVGSKNHRRVNRLRSVLVLPTERQETVIQRSELEPVAIAATEPQTVQEITGFDALVNAASSATKIETLVEEEKKDEESVQVISETVPVVSLEDRRAALFESLYFAYEHAIGRYCRPGMIEWTRANVFNWPEYIDKSDMSNWTEEHVELLTFLVDSGSIEFKPVVRGKKNPPKPLVSKREVFIMPIMPVTEQETKVAEEKAQVDFSSDSDLVSLSDNEIKNKPAAVATAPVEKTSALLKSESKKRKAGKMSNFKSVKVDSHLPANPERKASVLAEALKIYRRDSGHPAAEDIDWNSFKVFYLQNHILPFSTGFETEGDVRTLEALMKNKYFGFHNPQVISSRRLAIYERFYKMYAQVPGLIGIDPFLVKWNQINVIGWPKDVTRSYSLWKLQEVTKMECLLDAGEIRFTLNNGKNSKKMIRRTRIESSSDEESEYLSESSSSESSIEELVKSSDESVDSSSSSSGDNENAAAVLVVATNKRKRETKLFETATNENQVAIGTEENVNKITRMTVEVNETTEQIENLKTEIVAVIENLTKAKEETFAQNDRHKRIVSHLIQCFSLLQKHANNETLEIPSNEVLDFIEIFHKALVSIRVDGEMSQAALKNFVIGGIKLRARLAGIGYTQERGRRVFKIPEDRIKDTESFGVLIQAESLWTNELALLEFALDTEEPYIFS